MKQKWQNNNSDLWEKYMKICGNIFRLSNSEMKIKN